MKEQQWKKQVTMRLSDGFYMYRKVFSPRKQNKSQIRNQGTQTCKISTKNHSVQTISWIPCGTINGSRKPNDLLDRATYKQPKLQILMAPATGPHKKPLSGVPTPKRLIPAEVSTPMSLIEFNTYVSNKNEWLVNEKGQQFTLSHLGPNAISLSKQHIRDTKVQNRKRRRARREEKKRKRRKIITRWQSINIPSFPLPPIDELRRKFALTQEARLVTSAPRNGFLYLTNMIVDAQKESISKVYNDSGPFAFIAKACVTTLDLFREKMLAKSEDNSITKFDRCSVKLPRELELTNALKCIRERRRKISAKVRAMAELREWMAGGRLEKSVSEKVYPLPKPLPERVKFGKEELLQHKNLQRSHSTFSEIVMEKLTKKLSERWLLFEKELKDRQEKQAMSKVYDREIASAGMAIERSIAESVFAIS